MVRRAFLIWLGFFLVVFLFLVRENLFYLKEKIRLAWPKIGPAALVEPLKLKEEKEKAQQREEIKSPEPEATKALEKETKELIHPQELEQEKEVDLEEIQRQLKKISEEVREIETYVEKLKEEKIVQEKEEEDQEEIPKVKLCQKPLGSSPLRNQVIINEVAWMGNKKSAYAEWIELKNIFSKAINLASWQLLNKEEKIQIIFPEIEILANSFLLLKRGNDDSLPGIKADLIFKGAIKNKNEALFLFDQNCQLQDEVIAAPEWPAGDNKEKRTLERGSDFSWHTCRGFNYYGLIFGTPKSENSSGDIETSIYLGGSGAPPSLSYPKILISEIQIEGEEANHDFIELYNPNNFAVDISGYKLRKRTSSGSESSIRVFPPASLVPAKGYYLWASSKDENFPSLINADTSTKQTLASNNSLALFAPDDTIISILAWGSSSNPFVEISPFPENPGKNQSLGRIWDKEREEYKASGNNSADFEFQTPTPKRENQSLLFKDETPPEVNFNPISFSFNDFLFTLSWFGQDVTPSDLDGLSFVTPSGLDGFSLEYNVTPSDIDGISLWYQKENKDWQEWREGKEGEISLPPSQTEISLWPKEGKFYTFFLKAKDKAGNVSETIQVSTPEPFFTLPKTVVINEIAWMGTANSSNDEWIELYNNTGSEIDLNGWTLKAEDGTPEIKILSSTAATTTISAQGFYLLERTDDKTVSDIPADFIYRGALSNEGEKLELYDNFGNLIDLVDCLSFGQWFAGENSTKQTMERKNGEFSGGDPSNWADSQAPGGTPKAKNSVSS